MGVCRILWRKGKNFKVRNEKNPPNIAKKADKIKIVSFGIKKSDWRLGIQSYGWSRS